jgi:hypothetical protein
VLQAQRMRTAWRKQPPPTPLLSPPATATGAGLISFNLSLAFAFSPPLPPCDTSFLATST